MKTDVEKDGNGRDEEEEEEDRDEDEDTDDNDEGHTEDRDEDDIKWNLFLVENQTTDEKKILKMQKGIKKESTFPPPAAINKQSET